MIRVRFAPSPTGTPHVGGIRTALFNYFFAKSQNGVFILRNEDTDQARMVQGSVDATLESLRWIGVRWEEMVTQSERLNYYKKYAEELVAKGRAKKEDGAVRFITPESGKTSWTDIIGNKEISFENKQVEDFIILKKDGFPTYHLANVIDDHLMKISHVIRGEDWIPSTPKHLMLYDALGWSPPSFAHVPNVLGTDNKKLSKRRGAKSVIDFKNEGILPEALLNYLMLLGWSPKDDREILSIKEIVSEFKLSNINSSPSVFDERKLMWMNGEYIRKIKPQELSERLKDFDPSLVEGLTDEQFLKFVKTAQTRIKTLADFKDYISPFVNPLNTGTKLLKDYSIALQSVSEWTSPMISTATISFMKSENRRFPDIYKDLTGGKQGLPLGDAFEILGKDKTIALLK